MSKITKLTTVAKTGRRIKISVKRSCCMRKVILGATQISDLLINVNECEKQFVRPLDYNSSPHDILPQHGPDFLQFFERYKSIFRGSVIGFRLNHSMWQYAAEE